MASGAENLEVNGGSRWPSKEARLLADGPHSLDKAKRKKKLLIANKLVLEAYQEERPTQMFAVAMGRHSLFLYGGTQSVTEAGIATQVLISKLSFFHPVYS